MLINPAVHTYHHTLPVICLSWSSLSSTRVRYNSLVIPRVSSDFYLWTRSGHFVYWESTCNNFLWYNIHPYIQLARYEVLSGSPVNRTMEVLVKRAKKRLLSVLSNSRVSGDERTEVFPRSAKPCPRTAKQHWRKLMAGQENQQDQKTMPTTPTTRCLLGLVAIDFLPAHDALECRLLIGNPDALIFVKQYP